MIAALYVERGGPYFDRADVEAWDEARDATKYDGPWSVVAHPPCGAWGRLKHLYQGDDAHLGPIAVSQVRRWGGVLEHPSRSRLWAHCGLPTPGSERVEYDEFGGYALEVCQVDWGHVARKRTWLYVVGVPRDALTFPPSREPTHWISGFRSSTHRSPKHYKSNGSAVPPGIKVCSAQQRRRTPLQFANWLIGLAHIAHGGRIDPVRTRRSKAA